MAKLNPAQWISGALLLSTCVGCGEVGSREEIATALKGLTPKIDNVQILVIYFRNNGRKFRNLGNGC